jgi:hypothetical protein
VCTHNTDRFGEEIDRERERERGKVNVIVRTKRTNDKPGYKPPAPTPPHVLALGLGMPDLMVFVDIGICHGVLINVSNETTTEIVVECCCML